jgi:hypothetical protein
MRRSWQVIQVGRSDSGGDVEVPEHRRPPAVVLEPVHGDGVRPEVVDVPVDVVHPGLEIVPVLPPAAGVEPLAEEPVLMAARVVVPQDVLVAGHPLRDVPRHDVPHPVHERRGVVADGEAAAEVQVGAGLAPELLHERGHAQVRVVVGLHHVVVGVGREEPRHGGEVRVRLAVVHVLGAVQHQDVAVPPDLQRHQRRVHRVGHIAEHEADVHARPRGRRLQRVGHPHDVPALQPARHGEDADQQAELGLQVLRRCDGGDVGGGGASAAEGPGPIGAELGRVEGWEYENDDEERKRGAEEEAGGRGRLHVHARCGLVGVSGTEARARAGATSRSKSTWRPLPKL